MDRIASRIPRRGLLAFGAGAALTATVAAGGKSHAAGREDGEIFLRLAELEREHSARLGVFARDTATGRTVQYKKNRRFPLCSVFKTLAAAAVLRDMDHHGEFLARRIRYAEGEVERAGYAPVTGKAENLANGMSVAELCAAAVSESDSAAGNLLLEQLGGPSAVTRFCRSIGDGVTRLDRWEPELNAAETLLTDVTSPRAIGRTYGQLVLGKALDPRDRRRLTRWLLASTTGKEKLRAGLPAGWTVADKTGGGGPYGTNHDVGVAWPPNRPPIVLAIMSMHRNPKAAADNPLVAEAASLVAAELV
ncbi:class A beta-lactamase [Streptomyces luteireticuli]|uniref:Beta-lactamase n=1 Tax=Streptomyces luteireticuli TaxID=173858 RepID=A0ABN0YLA1_9ACTN